MNDFASVETLVETQFLDLCSVGELDVVSVQLSQYFDLCKVGLIDVVSVEG